MSIMAIAHFTGLKSVSESLIKPQLYWDVNVSGSANILRLAAHTECSKFVFSSSCTVYGDTTTSTISESSDLCPVNPYGITKLKAEDLIRLHAIENPLFKYSILRYFNLLGAHPCGLIGEMPKGSYNNLLPLIHAATHSRRPLTIYGYNLPAPDGTLVRDYVHVADLAHAHILSLNHLLTSDRQNLILNIGSGTGYSVLQVIRMYQSVTGIDVDIKFVSKREGDAISAIANPELAGEVLKWNPVYGLREMIEHHVAYAESITQSHNSG